MKRIRKISKVLSCNDTGVTGGHQSGICVPKDRRILDFFPVLLAEEKNPRVYLTFIDDEGQSWTFAFIYYNNIYYGGTRNEYRLTRMTKYIRTNLLKEGDEIILYVDENEQRRITYNRSCDQEYFIDGVLRIGKGWKVINFSSGG